MNPFKNDPLQVRPTYYIHIFVDTHVACMLFQENKLQKMSRIKCIKCQFFFKKNIFSFLRSLPSMLVVRPKFCTASNHYEIFQKLFLSAFLSDKRIPFSQFVLVNGEIDCAMFKWGWMLKRDKGQAGYLRVLHHVCDDIRMNFCRINK